LLKCNVNAAISIVEQTISMGTGAMAYVSKAFMTPVESEAWGLHQDLNWITHLDHQKKCC